VMRSRHSAATSPKKNSHAIFGLQQPAASEERTHIRKAGFL